LGALEVVWELTVEWDTAWESYKTREFWTTDIKEMEDNVSSYVFIMYIMQVLCYSFALLTFLILVYMLTLNATCTIQQMMLQSGMKWWLAEQTSIWPGLLNHHWEYGIFHFHEVSVKTVICNQIGVLLVVVVVQCCVISVHECVKYGNRHSYNINSEKYVCNFSFIDKMFMSKTLLVFFKFLGHLMW